MAWGNELTPQGLTEESTIPSAATGTATGAAGAVAIPEPSALAVQYYENGNLLWGLRWLWALAIPTLVLFSGMSARLSQIAYRIGRRRLPAAVVFGLIFLLVNFLLELPLAYYLGYVRPHAYGLSNQSLGKWFGDSAKSLLVGAVAISFVAAGLYWLIGISPRRWWWYAGLASLPLMFFVALILPVWVQPLFNTFEPLSNRDLDGKILRLAARAGVENSRVFQVNKSVDTKAVNAYVVGLGNTKRIVLWDTLIDRLNERQVLFVVAHEMGHYVLGHVWKTIAAIFTLLMVAFWLIDRAARWAIGRWSGRWGFSQLGEIASLPLLVLGVQLSYLLLSPPVLALSRYHEREADRFALELTQWNRDGAEGFVRLQQENLAVPRRGSLFQFFRGTHPTLAERIDFCNCYRPWEAGEPLRYEHLFTP